MNKLNVTFCSFPDFSSHAKALYLYMNKRYKDEMNLVWIVNTDEIYKNLKKNNIKVIKRGTKEFENYITKTDVFFTTHGNLIDYKNESNIYIDLWHGVGVKPAGYLINNLEEDDILWTNNFRNKVDFMIVPTDFWRIIFSSIFQIEPRRILPLGYPKFDIQIKSNGRANLSKILNDNVNKFKKIIYYMPTHSKREGRESETDIDYNKIFNLEDESEKDLKELLERNNILLCIKRHPSDVDNYKKIETNNIKNINNQMLEKHNLDVDQILNAADIMISDYSSLAIEFLYQKKQVIFINNNLNTFIDKRGIFFNDYNFWSENNSVSTFKELKSKILENSFLINEEKYNLWYGNFKNGGCKEICDYIFINNKINPQLKKLQIRSFNTKTNEEILEIEKQKNTLLNQIDKLEIHNNEISIQNEKLNNLNYVLNEELKLIKQSNSWKLISKIRKLYYIILRKKEK